MWDKPSASYEHVAQEIKGQLRQRLTALHPGAASAFEERRPSRAAHMGERSRLTHARPPKPTFVLNPT